MKINDQKRKTLNLLPSILGTISIIAVLFSPGLVYAQASESKQTPAAGNYQSCIACHGAQAKGNKALGAPGLANLEPDYIALQLRNFRDGLRGSHPDDTGGAQMRAFTLNLDDSAIVAVANVASQMEDYVPESHIKGNPELGKNYYYHRCGACHGAVAKGNAALKAPKLAGLDEWYVESQLNKFREGVRGTHAKDKLGAQMHYIMNYFSASEQITDIIAYLRKPIDAE